MKEITIPTKEAAEELIIKSTAYILQTFRNQKITDEAIEEGFEFLDDVYADPDFQIRTIENKCLVIFGLGKMNDNSGKIEYTESENNSVIIFDFYVEEKYRKLGLGGKLLEYVIDWSIKNHPDKKLRLVVDKSNNTAKCFYEDHGFRIYFEGENTSDWMIYNPMPEYRYTISTKQKQFIHGVLNWNENLGFELYGTVAMRLRDRKGVVGQLLIQKPSEPGEPAWIYCFAIKPELRGSGLGTKMLADAEAFIVSKLGTNVVLLHAQKDFEDRLIPFYTERGYRFVRFDPECGDEAIMKKVIREDI